MCRMNMSVLWQLGAKWPDHIQIEKENLVLLFIDHRLVSRVGIAISSLDTLSELPLVTTDHSDTEFYGHEC